jgi:hypothetical protein
MIYKMDVWHKRDAQGSIIQELYCLSDMHGVETLRPQDALMMNAKDQEQRAHLLAACTALKADNALWIVEDPFSVSQDSHTGVADYLKLYQPIAFVQPVGQQPILLHFLYDVLTQQGADVINVEYRQQRIVSHLFYTVLGELTRTGSPILKQFRTNINTLYGSTLQEVAQEFDRELARLREYAAHERVLGNELLADSYNAVIKKAEQAEPFIALLREYRYNYWDLTGATSPAVLSALVNAFLVWGMELVDVNALHVLYNAQDRKKICMILGGVHIAAISRLLPSLGYTKAQTVGADSLTPEEYDKRAQLLDQLYSVEQLVPQPVSGLLAQAWRALTHRWKKNILVSDLAVNADKTREFNDLNMKFAQVDPVDAACFDLLAGKK